MASRLPDDATLRRLLVQYGTITAVAAKVGRPRKTVSDRLHAIGAVKRSSGSVGTMIDHEMGEATLVSDASPDQGTIDELIRTNGLDPDDWVVVSTTLNEWEGQATGGGVQTLRQVKVVLRKAPHLLLAMPAIHVPDLVRTTPVKVSVDEPDLVVVESDHHAPYHDEKLDSLVTRLVHDLKPVEHNFLGDGLDLPTISKHADHPAAMAPVQTCIDQWYGILRRRADAAPNATRKVLKGNHDWRLESELLVRSERMYGIRPVGEQEHALSIARLCHFDRLGVELVTHPLGWEHAEIDIVPGPNGLGGRHGWLTGAKVPARSLQKRGRSLLVGHGHGRESHYVYDPANDTEREAHMIATMANVRSDIYPHYSVCDSMLQGAATVSRWRDGRFVVEHIQYIDGVLTWRDRRWES